MLFLITLAGPVDGVAVEDVVLSGYLALLVGCCMRQPAGVPPERVRDAIPEASLAPLGVVLTTFTRLQARQG